MSDRVRWGESPVFFPIMFKEPQDELPYAPQYQVEWELYWLLKRGDGTLERDDIVDVVLDNMPGGAMEHDMEGWCGD